MKLLLGLILSLSIISVTACDEGGNKQELSTKYCWRYKVTVEVAVLEEMKSGSAIREACMTPFEGYNPMVVDFKESVKGEAVVVDLGERGLLFAIMDQDGSIFDIERAYEGPKLHTDEGVEYYSQLPVGKQAELPSKYWPDMVIFKNINDPKSIISVYSSEPTGPLITSLYKITDNTTEVFGENVEIKNVTLEITDDPIEWNIKNTINKFGGSSGRLDRSRFERNFKNGY